MQLFVDLYLWTESWHKYKFRPCDVEISILFKLNSALQIYTQLVAKVRKQAGTTT